MLDSLDIKIIRILQKDARMHFSDIGKMLGVSPSRVQIRFNKMKRSGVILGTTLILNQERFGVKQFVSVGLKVVEPEVEQVIQYINTLITEKSKVRAWPTFGRFNVIVLLISRNALEVHRIRQKLKDHPSIEEVSLSLNISPYNTNYDSLGLEKELRSKSLGSDRC